MVAYRCLLVTGILLLVPSVTRSQQVAGKADVLSVVPKHFAEFIAYDADANTIELELEHERGFRSTWSLLPDVEVKRLGWWGRLEQFQPGERVWVWFAVDRQKAPAAVLMIADELTEQLIHGEGRTISTIQIDEITFMASDGGGSSQALEILADVRGENGDYVLTWNDGSQWRGPRGAEAYVQSRGSDGTARLYNRDQVEELRRVQQEWLVERWRDQGLPARVTFLHPLSGEMEVTVDHEGMRWARSLEHGDSVTLLSEPPVDASVYSVSPWREKTRLKLVTASGLDQVDLEWGQRLAVHVANPPDFEVLTSPYPAGIDREERSTAERIDWLMSSVYCPCRISGDRCTGMFYTHASCNARGCHMVSMMRDSIEQLMARGRTDRQIIDALRQERGDELLVPHLLR